MHEKQLAVSNWQDNAEAPLIGMAKGKLPIAI